MLQQNRQNKNDMSKIYLGIDPGFSGGIVLISSDGNLLSCVKMPATPMDILSYLQGIAENAICFLEDVGLGMPGQSSKATATFARHNGHLEMALMASGISAVKVTPAKWQKALGLSGKKGESKTSHKNRIKAWAQQRFPQHNVTLWAADALAIAEYGRRMNL